MTLVPLNAQSSPATEMGDGIVSKYSQSNWVEILGKKTSSASQNELYNVKFVFLFFIQLKVAQAVRLGINLL